MRIRGYDEETEELSEDYSTLSGDIADLTKTASNQQGVSLFTDDTKETYKSTYEVLEDISEIWDDLSDKNQAQLLEKLFGKTRAQAGSAILTNFDAAKEALKAMDESYGSADAEMGNVQQSIEYKLNNLKQTWVGFIQDLGDRGMIGGIIDSITALSEALMALDKLGGPLAAVAGLGGGIALTRNGFDATSLFSNIGKSGLKEAIWGREITLPEWNPLSDGTELTKLQTQFKAIVGKQLQLETQGLSNSVDDAITALGPSLGDVDNRLKSLISTGKGVDDIAVAFGGLAEKTQVVGGIIPKITSAFKSFAGMAANIGISMLASLAVSALFKGIGTLIDSMYETQAEKLEAGKKAAEEIKSIQDGLDSKKSSTSNLDNLYDALDKGAVNKENNENIRLSNEAYTEYLATCNELASMFPSLVSGYDSQGNAILELGNNADEARAKLEALIQEEERIAAMSIGEQIPDLMKGFETKYNDYKNQIESNQVLYDLYSDAQAQLRNIKFTNSFDKEDGEDIYMMRIAYDDISSEEALRELQNAIYLAEEESGVVSNSDWTVDQTTGERYFKIAIGEFQELDKASADAFQNSFAKQLNGQMEENKSLLSEYGSSINEAKYNIERDWNEIIPTIFSTFDGRYGAEYNDLSKTYGDGIYTAISSAMLDAKDRITGDDTLFNDFIYDTENTVASMFLYPLMHMEDPAKKAFAELYDTYKDESVSLSDKLAQIDLFESQTTGTNDEDYANKLLENFGFNDFKTNIKDKVEEMKELLPDATSEDLYSLSSGDFEIAYDLVVKDGFSGTFEQLLAKIAKTKDTISSSKTFASMFDDEFNKSIDDAQTKIQKVSDILSKMETGELTSTDITDTIQEYTQLAGAIEEAANGEKTFSIDKLIDLSADALDDEIKAVREKIRELVASSADQSEIDNARQYGELLIDSYIDGILSKDLEDMDTGKIFDRLTDSLDDLWEKDNIKNMSRLVSEYGGSVAGNAALLDLEAEIDLNPEMAHESYETLASWIESKIIEIQVKIKDKDIEAVEKKISTVQQRSGKFDSYLGLREAQGYSTTSQQYERQARDQRILASLYKDEYDINAASLASGNLNSSERIAVIQAMTDAYSNYMDALTQAQNYENSADNVIQQQLDNRIGEYERARTDLENVLDDKKTYGKVGISDYLNILNNIDKQIDTQQQKRISAAQQIASNDWSIDDQGYLDQMDIIYSADDAIRQLTVDSREYKEEMYNLPVEMLQRDLSNLQTSADAIQADISLKDATNKLVTESDYEALIRNGESQIDNLKAQNKLLEAQQKKVDKNSDKYAELKDQIDSNNSAIKSMTQSQAEWANTVNNLAVSQAKDLTSAITSALSEMNSSTGLAQSTIDSLMKSFSNIDGADDIFYRTAEGIKVDTASLKELVEQQFLLESSNIEDKLNTVKNSLTEQSDEYVRLLQVQSQYYAEYQEQLKSLSALSMYQNATSTANQGANYDTVQGALKTVQEAYQKGLTGTDDFKTFETYLNEWGFSDPESFAKDYVKASRYFTEDARVGINNMIQDMKALGDIEEIVNSDGSSDIIFKKNFDDIAHDLDISKEAFSDIMSKSEEFFGSKVYDFSDMSKASLEFSDLNEQIYEAQKKLIDMENDGADTSAIEKQKQVISDLEHQYEDLALAANRFRVTAGTDTVKDFSQLESTINNISQNYKDAIEKGDYTSAYKWMQDAKDLASKYGMEIEKLSDGTIQLTKDSKELYDNILGQESPKYDWDNINYGLAEGLSTKELASFTNAQKALIDANKKGGDEFESFISTLSQYDAEALKSIDLTDGIYNSFNGVDLTEAEQALDGLADYLGLSKEDAQMLALALESVGQTKVQPDIDLGILEEQTSTMNSLIEMQDGKVISMFLDLDYEMADMSIDEIDSKIEELTSEQHRLELMTQTDETKAAIEALKKEVDILTQQKHVLTIVQQITGPDNLGQSEQNREQMQQHQEITVDLDYSLAEMSIEEIDNKIQEFTSQKEELEIGVQTDDVTTAIDLLNSEVDVLTSQKHTMIITKLLEDSGSVDEAIELLKDSEYMQSNFNVDIDADAEEVDNIKEELEEIDGMEVAPDFVVHIDDSQWSQLFPENSTVTTTLETNVENVGEVEGYKSTIESIPEEKNISIGIDAGSTKEIDGITKSVEELPDSKSIQVTITSSGTLDDVTPDNTDGGTITMSVTVGDTSELDSIKESEGTITIKGDNSDALSKIDEAVNEADGATGTITIDGDNWPALDKGRSAVSSINSMSASITVNANTDNIASQVQSAVSGLSASITVNATVNGTVKQTTSQIDHSDSGGDATGTFTRANGSLLPAHARGGGRRVALRRGEKSLVNEEGSESIVRNGVWSLIPGGPHIENLKKGDIIFSR